MRSFCYLVIATLLALLGLANAWGITMSNMTGSQDYQQFKEGCYKPPAYYRGKFNQVAYIQKMMYVYESKDCTGYHTVISKTRNGWVNVYHPIRSYYLFTTMDH
ncbi:hypothetical protein H4R18_003416 [Coemansia javaensis]|uniref:Uncharacterized protein n=1 Tax=Coemansia javaensis TaxID=2761396 RepID=A0A9W8H969_9FUNG|nr:hypothetical protein H4R18_003416 [Coemansia javaensis]